MGWIKVTPDWGRIGPIWWINSNTMGVSDGSGWRWHYWGQVRIGKGVKPELTWIAP